MYSLFNNVILKYICDLTLRIKFSSIHIAVNVGSTFKIRSQKEGLKSKWSVVD